MNMGIHYLGENYGEEAVREYLTRFAERVYVAQLKLVAEEGITALAKIITDTYIKEKAQDRVKCEIKGGKLTVKISACPAVTHLRATGREVSPWFKYTTTVVMERFSKAVGKQFDLGFYSEEDGSAEYSFK